MEKNKLITRSFHNGAYTRNEHRTQAAYKRAKSREEKKRLADQAVSEAIQTIRNGGLKNDKVEFREDKNHVTRCSIVLYLMRQYRINVPHRTQGWINENLIDVTIKDGWCEGHQYLQSRCGRGSEVFFACMNDLIQAVLEGKEQNPLP